MQILRRLRIREGWTTLLLLWLMLLVAATAIMQTELIAGLHIIPLAVAIGLIAGMALAKSKFADGTAHLFAIVFGLFSIFYLLGTILPETLTWRERVFEIIARQIAWLAKAFGEGTSRDGLIFVIQTTVIYWLLGYTAAWYTFRYPRLWRVIVPSGLVLMSVVYYYNGPKPLAAYLAAYAVLALLFAARTHLIAQESEWQSASVRYERNIWFDFLRAAFVIALLALFFSWSLPTLSASPALNDALSGTQGPWREFQDNWTRLFSSLRAYGSETADPYQDTLALGGPRTVGNGLIMDVIVTRPLPYLYWQAIAYDTYEDGYWRVEDDTDTRLHFPDDGFVNVPETLARQVVEQTFINYLPNSSFLYSAPEMLATDRQMIVESRDDGQGKDLVSSVRSRFILRQGDRYNVVSRVSIADVQSLRSASQVYPTWVTERYLQLPDTVSPQTINLGAELTALYDNPFDKTIAVRDYLRNNIRYNEQIDAPPDNVDPVHHMLFTTQEGFCNYYASAMALMLRSQGIPARVVSGYAQGEFDEPSSSFRVRASNAHTWVEVYFPAYGWIQFEPTVSIPTVDRPETSGGGDAFASPVLPPENPLDRLEEVDVGGEAQNLADLLNQGDSGSSLQGFLANFPVWPALVAVVVVGIAAAVMVIASEFNKRVESDIDRSYQRLDWWARWFGIFYRPADTPFERADMMSRAVPEGRAPIRNLTSQYVRKQFSGRYDVDKTFDPRQEWQKLRPLLIRESIARRLRHWQHRLRGTR